MRNYFEFVTERRSKMNSNVLKSTIEQKLLEMADKFGIDSTNETDSCLLQFKQRCRQIGLVEDRMENDQLLRIFSHVTFDVTFREENRLVDDDFKDADAEQKVNKIIDSLQDISVLCNNIEKEPIDILGPDFAECLHWRQGALYYMFCATFITEKCQISDDSHIGIDTVLHFLKEGIQQLNIMLALRNSAEDDEDSDSSSEASFQLLKEGIFSSTHVLALMYSGEMCYWYVKLQSWSDDHKLVRDTGIKHLEKYIEVVEGPMMADEGFSSTRAKELLKLMLKMTNT